MLLSVTPWSDCRVNSFFIKQVLIEKCWKHKAEERPDFAEINQELQSKVSRPTVDCTVNIKTLSNMLFIKCIVPANRLKYVFLSTILILAFMLWPTLFKEVTMLFKQSFP